MAAGGAYVLPMTERTDILVTGGGLGGLTLSLALARAGLSVRLVDVQPRAAQIREDFDGRSYALALASSRMLRALGLWGELAEDAQPIEEIRVADGRAGEAPSPLWMQFSADELEERPMGFLVEDRHLRRAALDAVAAHPRIRYLDGRRVLAQQTGPSGATVELDDGSRHGASLLVGADGRASGTASRAGIARRGRDYGQTALVCALSHERPHGGIAHQYFMPEGPLAILPLKGNRSSIVWTQPRATAAAVAALDDGGYLAALRPRFGDFLGGISLAGARWSYPLALSLAAALTAPRLALVGDAARAIHPIAGQGLNAGLRDIAALTEVVAEAHRRGEDIGAADVLARYARWRRFDNTALALATDGFNKLFSNDNPVLRTMRDIGMGAVTALPGLRRGFIREAAGLTGDLPRLMRGQPA